MEDNDDSDAKLREEIEAELDKISISSLENDEVENDSESETQSDNSDTDLIELPESVLHCINVIKNKSKTAEELFLQDLEDIDVFSCSYGTVSNNHMHLRTGSAAESKANSEQLMKILSVIEKEEFMRSLTHSARSDSVSEPVIFDTPMEECILSDDADLNFGYFEVEERCRKSFEAWQDKQRELEDKDKETLEAQSDLEKQKFQEDDEKRHCWIKQFEAEKEKLENLQKQDQDKMNDELHKEEKIWKEKYREHEERIRNLHLQMEEERTRLRELQEKEKTRLLNLQHNAAVKIQATYRGFITYRKYSPIIREQIENKKRKAQERKEKEAKIRQKEEERRRRIEEEQKIEEERKKKMLEERRRREREYEEKKSILRQEREEQRNREKMRPREDDRQPLIISCALRKGEGHAKQPDVANVSKNKVAKAEELEGTNSKKQEAVCLVQQSNKRENVRQQLALTEPIGVKLKPSQAMLVESKMNAKNENLPKLKMNENVPKLKMNEKSENLPKKQYSEKLVNQEINLENIDRKYELKNIDLKENVNTQGQGQERKSQTQKEENVDHGTKENVGQETQIMFGFAATESMGVELKTSQAILTKLKINEKNENLPKLKMNEKSENLPKKQCLEKLVNQEINFENIDQKYELKNSDLKENVDTQCQGQERKTQTQKEENVEQATKENVGQETQIMFGFAGTESTGVELKPSHVILAELKMNEKNENLQKFKMNGNAPKLKMDEKSKNLPKKQCSEKLVHQEINLENIDQKYELKNSDLKENVNIHGQGQEQKSQTQKEENVEHVIKENVGQETQIMFGFAATESTGVELKPGQTILAELKMNEKNKNLPKFKMNEKSENLPKKQYSEKLVNQEINLENIYQKYELKNLDLKENVNTQCQGKGRKTQTQEEENVEQATKENVGQETQIMFGHKQEMSEEDKTGAQEIINDNQERLAEKVEKRDLTEQDRSLYEENYSISMQKDPLSLIFENPAPVERNVMLENKEIDLKSKRIEEIPKDNVLTCDAVIMNSRALVHTEGNTNQQGFVSGKLAPSEEAGSHSANSPLVTEEGDCPKSEIKAIPEQWKQTKAERDSGMACSLSQVTVLSSVKERRLAWIKSFKPWSEIFEQNQLKEIIKKKRLVKCPANTMPPLDTSAILRHGPWNTLQQVTAITFQDLPGCSLSTLAECTNLQLLSLRRCGLTSLHGLSHCKKLKYIDAQENHIETINCENLENLCVVLLNKNLLTSIHGLDGCTNIQNLELSHNKITRISGLESLKYLQQLTVDHNQLISTKGLCEAPTIVYLDCSHNHLTDVDGIGNCGLLQIVKLQGNYLREPPSLKNHVLLRELHLDDNSILNVEGLSSCWLPLLKDLSISQNSLTTIVPLFHFVSLEKLDVSNNCLSDLTSVMCWFNACYSLRELCLTGNPVLQEINWRHSILKILPALRILNGDILKPHSDVHIEEHYHQDLEGLLTLCQYQLQEFNLLTDKYITQKGDILTLHAADKLCHYYENLMKLSNECRRAHEHGDVNIIKRTEPDTEKKRPAFSNTNSTLQNKDFRSWTDRYKADSPDTSENLMDSASRPFPLNWEAPEERSQEKNMAQKNEQGRIGSPSTRRASFQEMKTTDSPVNSHQNTEHSETSKAAMLIQAQWRSYVARRQINFSAETHPTTTEPLHNPFTSNQTTSNEERRRNMNIQELREKAALHIQAVWKGFILRKKLAMALDALRNEESGEEYEEIDLEDFEYDEDALEKDWPVSDSTGFPSQTLPSSDQLPWPKNKNSQALKHDETSLPVPTRPAQAWLWNEKENLFSSEQTQLSSRSENRTLSRTPESNTSKKSLLQSEKEEKISEEWGFKDISTAQQMLKRAQKMKSKKLRKKLDPSVRLALFKKNNNEVSVTKPSKKTLLRRDGSFEDEEEDALSKPTTMNEKSERSHEYTYQWLHTQVGVPEATSSRALKCNHFLPELDPDVLNGGRVQLVARLVSREDTDLDLFSMTSGSALSVNREKKSQARRYSSGSSSCSSKKILAPMITNTRPSIKERISFRDNPVRLSGGWGSGKKKVKNLHLILPASASQTQGP